MTLLVYSIPEVCKNANSGRTTVYKAINEGHLVAHEGIADDYFFARLGAVAQFLTDD